MLAGLSSCGVGQVPKETERCGLPCKKIRYVGGRSLFRYNSARLFGRHGLLFWGGIVGHGLFFIYAMAPHSEAYCPATGGFGGPVT